MAQNKVLFVGLGGSGKSTYIKRLLNNRFEQRYLATIGVEVQPIIVNNTELTVWDTAGQSKFMGLKDGYSVQSKVAVIFVDPGTANLGLANFPREVADIRRTCGEIPIIIAINKWDIYNPVEQKHVQFVQKLEQTGFPIVKLSCRTGENVDILAQTILQFVNGHTATTVSHL